jgi:hypothetical protein
MKGILNTLEKMIDKRMQIVDEIQRLKHKQSGEELKIVCEGFLKVFVNINEIAHTAHNGRRFCDCRTF